MYTVNNSSNLDIVKRSSSSFYNNVIKFNDSKILSLPKHFERLNYKKKNIFNFTLSNK